MISKQHREAIKQALVNHPLIFRVVRSAYIRLSAMAREVVTLARLGPGIAFRGTRTNRTGRWHGELPVQLPRRVIFRDNSLSSEAIEELCRVGGLSLSTGGDSMYLPPDTFAAMPFGKLSCDYPANVGLKIARIPGTVKDRYVGNREGRGLTHRRSFPHLLQTLTFNYLHLRGISPRLFDLIEIEDAEGVVWTAYVVEHIDDEPPKDGDCAQIVASLQGIEKEGGIELISGAGWSGMDFDPPDCNRNLRRERGTGKLFYVDIHNFVLKRYERHLTELAKTVSKTSHFGTQSRVLGGSFLYQEVPGVDLPAKRSPCQRMKIWDRLLGESGLRLENKVVLDVGCNLGLMGAEYLRRGARWLHGWDMQEMVEAARNVLLSIGCTRFSLVGGEIEPDIDLVGQLPGHLSNLSNEDVVLSYLAIRGHIGWLSALGDLPWCWMLYEGHQDDGDLESYVAELNRRMPVQVVAAARVADAVSTSRDVAIIRRVA